MDPAQDPNLSPFALIIQTHWPPWTYDKLGMMKNDPHVSQEQIAHFLRKAIPCTPSKEDIQKAEVIRNQLVAKAAAVRELTARWETVHNHVLPGTPPGTNGNYVVTGPSLASTLALDGCEPEIKRAREQR